MRIFDLETNGLLEAVSEVHVLGIKTVGKSDSRAYRKGDMKSGVTVLTKEPVTVTDLLIGHNVIKYDVPVLRKLFPGVEVNEKCIIDTLVLSRLVYPNLADTDYKRKNFPLHLAGRHSLEAWGYRLGIYKGEYEGDTTIEDEELRKKTKWDKWNQDMEDYCLQDLEVTEALFNHLMSLNPSAQSVRLEHDVAWILARQERYGFLFDKQAAGKLYGKLSQRKDELERQLKNRYGYVYVKKGPVKSLKNDKLDLPEDYLSLSNKERTKVRKLSAVLIPAGVKYTELKHVPFNPGSRDQIIKLLKHVHGWIPKDFTPAGKPQVDEKSLKGMTFPEAPMFTEYFLVEKRIGQVAEGKQAWLKQVRESDGRMHGSVNTNGAVTGRMTHSNPNVAQTPAGYSPYGPECRACFIAPPGRVLVGADAAALELRDLAGYMAKYDGGAYIDVVVNGRKEDGTEIHTVNRKALEIDSRDDAKTWFYAFIYGAGDEKLGTITLKPENVKAYWFSTPSAQILWEQRRGQGRPVTKRQACYIDKGGRDRYNFLKNLPALDELTKAVKKSAKARGYLKGLDGRILSVRSEHAALNTLLQSAGAVQMKMALVILDSDLQAIGLRPGSDYEFVANIHDEWQIECNKELGDVIGKAAVAAIRKSGEVFGFRCPLDGEYRIGQTWAETH